MDLKQLRSFIAVANTLNFGRAAWQLHLSQSALSIQIQNLDAHLGVWLLERNRRTVRLTAAGESVIADSGQLLRQITDIKLRAARKWIDLQRYRLLPNRRLLLPLGATWSDRR